MGSSQTRAERRGSCQREGAQHRQVNSVLDTISPSQENCQFESLGFRRECCASFSLLQTHYGTGVQISLSVLRRQRRKKSHCLDQMRACSWGRPAKSSYISSSELMCFLTHQRILGFRARGEAGGGSSGETVCFQRGGALGRKHIPTLRRMETRVSQQRLTFLMAAMS